VSSSIAAGLTTLIVSGPIVTTFVVLRRLSALQALLFLAPSSASIHPWLPAFLKNRLTRPRNRQGQSDRAEDCPPKMQCVRGSRLRATILLRIDWLPCLIGALLWRLRAAEAASGSCSAG
jgi:hypothetical protein